MGSTTKKGGAAAPAPTEDKPKVERKRLTPAERIARAEAELKAAREKAEAEVKVKAGKLEEQRAKLLEQINERRAKVDAIEAELAELGVTIDDHSADEDDRDPLPSGNVSEDSAA